MVVKKHTTISHTHTTTREAQTAAPDLAKPPGYEWATPGISVQLRKDCEYSPHPNNPVQGSKYACRGTINTLREASGFSLDARPVSVDWSNGRANQYFFEDLEPYDDSLWGVLEPPQEKKKGKLFNEGDIVFLRPGFKTATHIQPALGTSFQCPGTVETAKHDNIGVRLIVKWYNSLKSEYIIRYETEKDPSKSILINAEDKKELRLFVEENPNFAYKLNKDTQHHDNFGVFGFFKIVMGIEEKLPEKEDSVVYQAEYFSSTAET